MPMAFWEGSGNVICLDVRRALAREPETANALLAEISAGGESDVRLGASLSRIRKEMSDASDREAEARQFVERLAVALAASLMIRQAPPAIAEAFVASRLSSDWGRCFGTLPSGLDYNAIIDWGGIAG